MPQGATWELQIEGELRQLERLARNLPFTQLWLATVSRGPNGSYFVRSRAFENCIGASAVRAKAPDVIASLSGIARLSLNADASIRATGAIHLVHDNGGRDVIVMIEGCRINVECGLAAVVISGAHGSVKSIPPPKPMTVRLSDLAEGDPAAAKVFLLLGGDNLHSWPSLYRLIEVIEGASGSIADAGWSSSAQRTRFNRTAKSVGAAGDGARHGVERTEPPHRERRVSRACCVQYQRKRLSSGGRDRLRQAYRVDQVASAPVRNTTG